MKTVDAMPMNQFGALSCPTPQRCYVLGHGSLRGLWATSDAGKNWVKRRLPSGTVLKTVDGGVTWKKQGSGTGLGLSEVCFTDATHGFAVGADGVILHTDDGGEQWIEQSSGTTSGLSDFCFVDRLHGWAIGKHVRLRTTDGGKTWKRL